MAKKKEDTPVGVSDIMDVLNKTYGANTIMKINDPTAITSPVVSSGSLLLDEALGGGYGTGRIIEVYGGESTGKTTLALHFLAQFEGKPTLYIDAEHALDKDYAEAIGVDMDNMLITQPDYLEQGLDILDKFSETMAAIVFDSIAGSPPKKEVEGGMEDEDIGVKARRMGRALRMINPKLARSGCTVFFINQTRDKIGPFAGKTRPGGNAMKFHASQTLEVYTTSAGKIEYNDEQIGHYLNIKVVKNKLAAPFKTCAVPIIYGQGISKESEVLDLGVQKGVIEKNGSWYSYNGAKLAQGAVNSRTMLEDNPELMAEIIEKLKTE